MKKVLCLIMCVLLAAGMTACTRGGEIERTEKMKVAALKGPTAVGMVDLMARDEYEVTGIDYDFSLFTSPEELAPKIIKGEFDVAALPTNLAATLYNKTGGAISVLAVNTYGTLYVVEKGDTVNGIGDLSGKTVYLTGQGASPEYALRYILTEWGIDPDGDTELEFVGTNDELIAKLVSGEATVAMLPEPAATTALSKIDGLRRAIDVNAAWDEVSPESGLMMGCIAVNRDYLAAHPDTVKKFLSEYKKSIAALSDNEAIAGLCVKYSVIPNKEIAASAIPYCHIGYCDGAEMKERLSGYFEVLYKADPKSIGGAMPGEDFWYMG